MDECGSLDPTARPTAQQLLHRLSRMLEVLQSSRSLGGLSLSGGSRNSSRALESGSPGSGTLPPATSR